MAPNQNMNLLRQKYVYSKKDLLALQCKASKSFDFSFLKDPALRDLKPHKRGKRGGVRLRTRKRKYKLPLPTIVVGNAQSLGNKCDELIACCKFQNEYREANLICFSETWLSPDQADPDLPGFNVYRLDRCSTTTGKKRGGGVCIFINNQWCTNITLKEAFCEPDIELLSLALRPYYLPREFPSIFVTVVYIHPGANYKVAANTLADVHHRLSSLSPESPSFILGDFNQCRVYKVLPNLKQYITQPTCGNNILDRCYGTIKDAYQSHVLPNLGRSAHRMVQLIPRYVQRSRQVKPVVKTIKVWSKESTDRLNACFDCTDWDVLTGEDNPLDEVTDVVSSYISFCVDSCVETKTVKVYPNNSKPWVDKDLRELFDNRKKAMTENNEEERKSIQKKIDSSIRKGKAKYKDKLKENFEKGNSRKSWENMNTITGYKQKKTGIQTEDELRLANDLNTFYTRFDKRDFKCEQQQAMNKAKNNHGNPILATVEDVRNRFKHLNARSASGPDNVSSKTLKICCDSLAPVYVKLFNRSFREGHVPKLWRTSTIVPVPKKKSITQLNDYRPVALTSVPMKCAERIVLKQLRSETEAHQDPLQFAYTANRNTQDAILMLMHNLHNHLDKQNTYARLLFVDFSSAFNTLQPHLLIDKLCKMNVNPFVISWVFSFMTDRPQQVRVGAALSDVLVTNTGAPQGCVLSPVLFTIYTADCRAPSPDVLQIKFADDTSLSGLVANSDETAYREAVSEMVDWCDEHFLELNVTKTEEMIVDFRRKKEPVQPLIIKGEEVRQVATYKYLGTTIDDQLSWTPNVDACVKKANQRLFFLRKLRQFKVGSNILYLFYQSVIQSILCYNQLCYYSALKDEDAKRLNRVVEKSEYIVGQNLDTLDNLNEKFSIRKAQTILDDASHPMNPILVERQSRRVQGRYLSFKCNTSRYAKTFIPTVIRTLNKRHERI